MMTADVVRPVEISERRTAIISEQRRLSVEVFPESVLRKWSVRERRRDAGL